MSGNPIQRSRGLLNEIMNIMQSGQWMTASMIASQIIWPPEISRREFTKRLRYEGKGNTPTVTPHGAHTIVVSRKLSDHFLGAKSSGLERREIRGLHGITAKMYEYRLKCKKHI
jgi:hypothetical protein